MVRQGGSETTVRIELKRRMDDGGWTTADVRIELKRQMANGGCQTAVLAVVNIATVVLRSPSPMMFLTVAVVALRHRPTTVIIAAVWLSVFPRHRRAAVHFSIPTATTTRTTTMTRTMMTTRMMVTAPTRIARRECGHSVG